MKRQPKDKKFFSKISLGHQGPRRRDIPDSDPGMSWSEALCARRLFLLSIRHGKAAMSRDLGREVPGFECACGLLEDFILTNHRLVFLSLVSLPLSTRFAPSLQFLMLHAISVEGEERLSACAAQHAYDFLRNNHHHSLKN